MFAQLCKFLRMRVSVYCSGGVWRCAGAGVRMCCCSLSVEKAVASMVPGLAKQSALLQHTVRSKHLHCALHALRAVQANMGHVPKGPSSKLPRVMHKTKLKHIAHRNTYISSERPKFHKKFVDDLELTVKRRTHIEDIFWLRLKSAACKILSDN